MPARKKLGRPTEIPDRVRLDIYLSARELRAIAQAAKRANVSTSAWVRDKALTALTTDRTRRTRG
jgi:hypothetical protein